VPPNARSRVSGSTKNLPRSRRSSSRLGPASSARSVGRRAGRDYLATGHSNLVAEHDDFNGQLVAVTPAQAKQLEDTDEGKIENDRAMAQFRRSEIP
jgi:hypothetical protein